MTTSQPEATLIEFIQYNVWANQQLLTLCMGLDESLLTVEIAGSAGTILETFAHLLQAEAGFLRRLNGQSPQPTFRWESAPSLSQMANYADKLGHAFGATIEQVSPTENVHEENETWLFDYQARLIFMSHIYHGIAHRTDITTFLNAQGVALPELDVWGFQEAYPGRFAATLRRRSEADSD